MSRSEKFSKPVSDLILARYSCRTYRDESISQDEKKRLLDFISSLGPGPFGNRPRFEVVASSPGDSASFKDFGTYGFIKNPKGFVAGALRDGEMNIEDYGLLMEEVVLFATDIGLGTCWLGGTFSRSRFAKEISLSEGEIIPAVMSIGYKADKRVFESLIRWQVGADQRKPWADLFFHGDFSCPVSEEEAGGFAGPLEMLRRGPSASNKQPWRIVKERGKNIFHLFLQRSKGYRERNTGYFGMPDMQRLDMGIAMCHFALAAQEKGMDGRWIAEDPGIECPFEDCHYVATWVPDSSTASPAS